MICINCGAEFVYEIREHTVPTTGQVIVDDRPHPYSADGESGCKWGESPHPCGGIIWEHWDYHRERA